jgi:hypothetical protein
MYVRGRCIIYCIDVISRRINYSLNKETKVGPETSAVEATYDQCTNNGNKAPCIDEHGSVVYYCDDPRSGQAGDAGCMPSPKEWANFLPECNYVNFESSCSGAQGPYFTCNDPEFHIEKYPYGCLENGKLTKKSS